MASTKFPRKEFEKYIKLNKEIEERISMMGTHLESINDEEIELEILPNRPDLFSLQGFMRSFLSFIEKGKKKDYKIKKSDYKIIVDSSVKDIRPYSMAAVVKNIKLDNNKIVDLMQWQEKIHATIGRNRKKVALGYYILEKINWPVTYKALEPDKIAFIPLDTDTKMNAHQILQRHPTGREYAKQLSNFSKFPVYIDSKKEILSMPPIINSNSIGKITEENKNLLIECSGTDLDTLKRVISMAVIDLIDLGGEAFQVTCEYGNKKESISLEEEKIKINIDDCNKLLGLELNESNIKKLVVKMGYGYEKNKVLVPAYRTDIMHPVDIYEDIAIAYGYENFKPEIPELSSIAKESSSSVFKRKMAEILTGLGMVETSSLHLLTKEDLKKQGIKAAIEVEESKTDYKFLRHDMLISILKILSENIDAEYPQKIFELGVVFRQDENQETGILEKNNLVVSLAPGNFTEIKQVLEYLERMLGIKLELQEDKNDSFIEGRTCKIMHNNKKIGILGEISPQTLKNWKIKMPLTCLELNVDELLT